MLSCPLCWCSVASAPFCSGLAGLLANEGSGVARRCPKECPKKVAQLITRCKAVDSRQRPSAREVYDILIATPDECVAGTEHQYNVFVQS